MPHRYTAFNRYSSWDGSQSPKINADDIMAALSEDLMEFGDLEQAMRYMMQRGFDGNEGNHIQGMRDMLKQLKEQRSQRLEQYDMSSVLDDIRRQLDDILAMERATIEDWKNQHEHQAASDRFMDNLLGDLESEPNSIAPNSIDPSFIDPDSEEPTSDHQSETDQNALDQNPSFSNPSFSNRVLGDIGSKNQAFLDDLPPDPAGQVRALEGYEFLNAEAQKKFLKLLDDLKRSMTRSYFNDVQDMVKNMSAGDIERMKQMVIDLNEMLVKKIAGEDPGFDDFMQKYDDMFGDNPPKSLDELLAQMQQQMAATQSMLNSMSPEQQQQLQQLMSGKFGDSELEHELAQLQKELQFLNPQGKRYNFSGDGELDLQAAMELMREMQELDALEHQLQKAQYDGNLDKIDADKLQNLLGDQARENLEEMQKLMKVLEDAGYVRRNGDKWQLTPRGSRNLGQKALGEIYQRLKKQNMGNHATPEEGRFGERLEESKPYEFGDPFHLHMPRTMRNAINREGPGAPIRLQTEDFEIYRSEQITETATVLMVDLSWSMALRGSFQSAKKVAMALHHLISSAYPRDSLYVIGFSAIAKDIQAHDLAYLQYDDYLLGTNMQHALILAEKKLAKHPQGTRQIIMITDGEPTAHIEDGRPVFSYPPTPACINKTLREVRNCTTKGITINTFMLDQSDYLKAFVDQMTKINGGRVFYAEPHNLGEYLLVDYVQNKKKRLRRG